MAESELKLNSEKKNEILPKDEADKKNAIIEMEDWRQVCLFPDL